MYPAFQNPAPFKNSFNGKFAVTPILPSNYSMCVPCSREAESGPFVVICCNIQPHGPNTLCDINSRITSPGNGHVAVAFGEQLNFCSQLSPCAMGRGSVSSEEKEINSQQVNHRLCCGRERDGRFCQPCWVRIRSKTLLSEIPLRAGCFFSHSGIAL